MHTFVSKFYIFHLVIFQFSPLGNKKNFNIMIKPGGHISVIGAGTMGNGIAHVFAQNGFKVSIVDVSLTQLDKAVANISKNF
ncbi:MAG TPA: 3-hydroxyacyl-CoA dehydrogenase NAD-binding domain-containing protein, partial [Chitinophagaceae bacterium]|nr:3-hydroxyacyl-CoA dehydrogenase NAD-binding domain-containing protein [Chitinophagaceae bacterium]